MRAAVPTLVLLWAGAAAAKPSTKEVLLAKAVQALPANKTAAALNLTAAALGIKAEVVNGSASASVWGKHLPGPLAKLLSHVADEEEWKAEELAGMAQIIYDAANPVYYPPPPQGTFAGTPWTTDLVEETSTADAAAAAAEPRKAATAAGVTPHTIRPPLPQNPPGTRIKWDEAVRDWVVEPDVDDDGDGDAGAGRDARAKDHRVSPGPRPPRPPRLGLQRLNRFGGVPEVLVPGGLDEEQARRVAELQEDKGLSQTAALSAVAATPGLSTKAAYLWYLLHYDLADTAASANPLVVPDVPEPQAIDPPADAVQTDAPVGKALPAIKVFQGNAANPPPPPNGYIYTPPDGAIAVGGGYSIQGSNVMITYRNASTGAVLGGPYELSAIFGNTADFGDPRILFDSYYNRFYVAAYGVVYRDDGRLNSYTYIATSKSLDPRRGWYSFRFSNQVNAWEGCSGGLICFGDYPMLGQDRYSLWVTTNQFAQSTDYWYWGGQGVWALGKTALRTGNSTVPTFKWWLGYDIFSLQPSKVSEPTKMHLMATYTSDSFAYAYATGTQYINYNPPRTPVLTGMQMVPTNLNIVYPPQIVEANGNPLRDVGNRLLLLTQPGERPGANAKLYATTTSACQVGGETKACIAYFILTPNRTSATVTLRGAIGYAGRHTFVGAIAAHPTNGNAGIVGTTTGSTTYPFASCFYRINGTTGRVNQAFIIRKSAYLYDFSYPSRSGDYNDAVVTAAGDFYGQTEYGVNGTEEALPYTNWGTWIIRTAL